MYLALNHKNNFWEFGACNSLGVSIPSYCTWLQREPIKKQNYRESPVCVAATGSLTKHVFILQLSYLTQKLDFWPGHNVTLVQVRKTIWLPPLHTIFLNISKANNQLQKLSFLVMWKSLHFTAQPVNSTLPGIKCIKSDYQCDHR